MNKLHVYPNNNLSQKLNGRNVKWFPEGESLATIITESVEVSTYGITPKSCPSETISGGFGYGTLITAGGRGNQGYGYGFAIYAGTNTAGSRVFATYNKDDGWSERVSKSDLTDIIMVKSFRGTSITIAENASEKISIPISTPTGYKVVGKISEMWINGPEMYLSQVDLTPTTFTGFATNLRNSEATSIPTISVLFVKS